MVALSLLGGAGWQFFDNNGNPLTGGKLYTYDAGTTTPAVTYTSSSGSVPNPNPIILDSAGRVPSEIWLSSAESYKFSLFTADNVSLWVKDDVYGAASADDLADFIASLAAPAGSSLVGFIQDGANAVVRTAQDKMRDIIDVRDYDSLQSAINAVKGSTVILVDNTSIRYGSKAIRLQPGVYDLPSDDIGLLIDGDCSLICDTYGGALLRYMGTGKAVVINSEYPGPFNSAPQNVRVLRWDGVSIYAPNATHGVFFGASTQRHITLERGQVYGPDYGVYASEAVYFLGLKNFEVRGCGVGAYAGPYCDLFTVDDRTTFSRNTECDLDLECPTFFIQNCDFEGGINADCSIRVKNIDATNAELRAGLIQANRFGPEANAGVQPYKYDIRITDNGVAGAIDSLRIKDNIHVSYTDGRRKDMPVYIDGKVKRLTIDDNKYIGYPSVYVDGDAVKTLAGGAVVADNFISDIFAATDTMKSVFTKTNTIGVRPLIAAANNSKNVALRYIGLTTVAGYASASVTFLPPSGSSTNYNRYAGVLLHDVLASRVCWVADPNLVITTTLDSTGATALDPVYLSTSGTLSLTPTSAAFRIARLLTVGPNARMVVYPQDQGGG